MLRYVAITQLFASIPKNHKATFDEKLYYNNISRFATQSFVLVGMDLLSLLVYFSYYMLAGNLRPAHIAVHLVKIAAMAFSFWLFSRHSHLLNYSATRFTHRNIDLLYIVSHSGLEFCLFIAGPQDLGALVRFLAVPFVAGSIPIMRQVRAGAVLGGLYFLYSWALIWRSGYAAMLISASYVLNALGIACVCSVLISNVIYSAYVNHFTQAVREQQDQAELRRLNDQLQIIARRDQLTGLSNRHDFDQYIALTWAGAQSAKSSATFIFFDVDHFRLFCDRFGQLAGDEALIRLTSALQGSLGSSGFIFSRYGGKEFIIAAYGQPHADMVHLGDELRQQVEELKIENPDSGVSPYLTISVGVVTLPATEVDDHRALIDYAVECHSIAKRAGRNRLVHLDPETRSHKDADGNPLDAVPSPSFSGSLLPLAEQTDRALRETGLDCTFTFSRRHGLLVFSPHAQQLLGMPSSVATLSLTKVLDLLPLAVEDSREGLAFFRSAILSGQPRAAFDLRLQSARAREWISVRAALMYDDDGQVIVASGSIFLARNILAYSSYTYEQAMVDTVTLLPSRKRFYTDIDALLSSGHVAGHLLLFDISDFKSINSIFSHSIGDKTLRKVGNLIEKMVGDAGQVYHYTTDQFIVCVESTSHSYIESLVSRILHFFSTYDISIEGIPIRISFYVGAVLFGTEEQVLSDLMVDLDIALQKAKLEHTHRLSLFCNEDKADYLARMNLEKQLIKSIDGGFFGFSLSYQPLFNKHGRCIGAEALLRYHTPDGELISPLSIIPLLEHAGLIDDTGQWVLAEACRQCRLWVEHGAPADFFVNVNLSASQLEKEDFANSVFTHLEKNSLQPHNLVLEVTESVFLSEASMVVSGLIRLRNAGVKIAIDDFGTGYSSFGYLRTLPADEIKIDKSFIDDADRNEEARRVLLSIVVLLKGMGFTICIEGVETEAQMQVLQDAPIDLYQGYLFGKPASPDSFEHQWLL